MSEAASENSDSRRARAREAVAKENSAKHVGLALCTRGTPRWPEDSITRWFTGRTLRRSRARAISWSSRSSVESSSTRLVGGVWEGAHGRACELCGDRVRRGRGNAGADAPHAGVCGQVEWLGLHRPHPAPGRHDGVAVRHLGGRGDPALAAEVVDSFDRGLGERQVALVLGRAPLAGAVAVLRSGPTAGEGKGFWHGEVLNGSRGQALGHRREDAAQMLLALPGAPLECGHLLLGLAQS